MIKIYGRSDDLLIIEKNGHIREEICYFNSSKELPVFIHILGIEVHAYYDFDGLWKLDIITEDLSHNRTLWKATDPDSNEYSDVLTIENVNPLPTLLIFRTPNSSLQDHYI